MSSHNSSSSSANDPRQPSAAKPYVQPIVLPQDLPVDYAGFIAVVFGVAGVMFRVRIHLLLFIIFSVELSSLYIQTHTNIFVLNGISSCSLLF